MPYKVTRSEDYLEHHGIKGQKWGVKNGPPYPLEGKQFSPEERERFLKRAKKADLLAKINLNAGSDFMNVVSQTEEFNKALNILEKRKNNLKNAAEAYSSGKISEKEYLKSVYDYYASLDNVSKDLVGPYRDTKINSLGKSGKLGETIRFMLWQKYESNPNEYIVSRNWEALHDTITKAHNENWNND